MSVSITIRGVPDEVRDELAGRAARDGESLQEYLLRLLQQSAMRPPVFDVLARSRARVDVVGSDVAVEATLHARDADRR